MASTALSMPPGAGTSGQNPQTSWEGDKMFVLADVFAVQTLTDSGALPGSTSIFTIIAISGVFERLPKSSWPKQIFHQTLHLRSTPNRVFYLSMFKNL
jgi:hypothetical protein